MEPEKSHFFLEAACRVHQSLRNIDQLASA